MGNINTTKSSESAPKKTRWRNLQYTLLLATLMNINNPTEAKTTNIYNTSKNNIEVLQSPNIISNIEKRTWVKIPKWYADIINNFATNNEILKNTAAAAFTENFIVKQMESNRWISKENQLLFIWDIIYEHITYKNFYDGEDWDDNRLAEFENTIDYIEKCWEIYEKEFIAYMNQRSEEAKRRSAQAERRSTEIRQEAMKLDSLGLKEISRFYKNFIKNPSNIKDNEIQKATNVAKDVIKNSQKYWIDYKALLLEHLWDKKKVEDLLKFYWIE